ncbi:hypothetical protein CDAR_540731 [Caerostris darwini]|uniref:Uncharacterized protein n=1 Tax=Caerostris darwini TaxID=1538125 RepID=A0AAV4VN17_9ARAC|nr:hypothetical protein CDAR_540731 [Caerostris darwini]
MQRLQKTPEPVNGMKILLVGDPHCGKLRTVLALVNCGTLIDISNRQQHKVYTFHYGFCPGKVIALYFPIDSGVYMVNEKLLATIDVFVFCFAIDNRKSFRSIERKWLPLMKEYPHYKNSILVANKVDLRTCKSVVKQKGWNPVSGKEAREMWKRQGFVAYEECSVAQKTVYQILRAAVDMVRNDL